AAARAIPTRTQPAKLAPLPARRFPRTRSAGAGGERQVVACSMLTGVLHSLPMQIDHVVRFEVFGVAKPAGSKRPFRRGDGSLGVRDANDDVKEWKNIVTDRAYAAMKGRPPLDGALGMMVTFFIRRPKTHFGTGRNAHVLKASAPAYPY